MGVKNVTVCDNCGDDGQVTEFEIRDDKGEHVWLDLDAKCAQTLRALMRKGRNRKRTAPVSVPRPAHSVTPLD